MPKKPKKPVLAHFAVLDGHGILQRYEAHPADSERPDLVRVPADCDLAPGRYRWDGKAGRFDPVPPRGQDGAGLPPDAVRAIWKGLKSLQDAGHRFPEETSRWIASYGATLDAKG